MSPFFPHFPVSLVLPVTMLALSGSLHAQDCAGGMDMTGNDCNTMAFTVEYVPETPRPVALADGPSEDPKRSVAATGAVAHPKAGNPASVISQQGSGGSAVPAVEMRPGPDVAALPAGK